MAERYFKTDALILASRPLGEADRVVTLLTYDLGKLDAVAKGARKTKSKLAAGVDLFTYGHYQLYRGRSLSTLTGQHVKEHFYYFREDPDLYPYGLYFSELTGRLINGEEPCPEVCHLLLQGWRLLGEPLDKSLLCRAFELKLTALTGYSPFLQGCLHCGVESGSLFSPVQGGMLCPRCAGTDAFKVARGTAVLAERLLNAPLQQVKQIRATGEQQRELARLTATFLRYHLDIGKLYSTSLLDFAE